MRFLAGVLVMVIGASCSSGAGGDSAGDVPLPKDDIPLAAEFQKRTAVFAGGCFWCTEAIYEQIPGVIDVVSGYAGDSKEKANYEAVSSGTTNHAEAVQVTYDASKVTYGKLLQVFFATHDPTTLNRQGPDTGRQYRSAIFYANDGEKRVAGKYIEQLKDAKVFGKPIVTTLEPLKEFFPAEQYHQDYARENPLQPYIQRYALPKAAKAREKFGKAAAPTTAPTTHPAD